MNKPPQRELSVVYVFAVSVHDGSMNPRPDQGNIMPATTSSYGQVNYSVPQPLAAVPAKKPYVPQPAEYVREAEYEELVEAVSGASQHARRARAVLALMYFAGLRRGEVMRLTRSQVHLGTDEPHLEIRRSKKGRGRNIPLDPRLREPIEEWLQHGPESEFLICTYMNVKPGPISKGSPIGSQATGMTIWAHVQTAKKRAGITRTIKPHMFRHAAATNWLRNGLNLREVQYMLGHKNLHTTQKYLHVHDDEVAKKVYALGGGTPALVVPEPVGAAEMFSPPRHKACPYCAEDIRHAAVFCRWCNRDLPVAS